MKTSRILCTVCSTRRVPSWAWLKILPRSWKRSKGFTRNDPRRAVGVSYCCSRDLSGQMGLWACLEWMTPKKVGSKGVRRGLTMRNANFRHFPNLTIVLAHMEMTCPWAVYGLAPVVFGARKHVIHRTARFNERDERGGKKERVHAHGSGSNRRPRRWEPILIRTFY